MDRINVASAIMVDGVTRMSADNSIADITYIPEESKYIIIGRKTNQETWVHSSNIQWARPSLEQTTRLSRSTRTNKEA